MVDQKQIAGIMNLDDNQFVIPNGHHSRARNIIFRGNPGNMRIEIVKGNTSLENVQPDGDNVNIGDYYDAINNRIFSFYYNSDGNHYIEIYNTLLNTFQVLIQNGVNTNGDVLGFSLTVPIYNIDIIYGSDVDGDLLHFIDCDYRPRYINIKKMLAGDYGVVDDDFLDVAKQPATHQPIVAIYQDDSTKTVNNLRKKLFRFCTEFVYIDNQTSVNSSISEAPLPYNLSLAQEDVDADPTKNNNILLIIQTGESIVKKVNIYVQQNEGSIWSDFYKIKSIDKEAESVADNDVYSFQFYNSEVPIFQDKKKSELLFDWVPRFTRAQCLANGNVIVYGAITEGFNKEITADVTLTALTHAAIYSNSLLQMSVTQAGETGARTGDIKIILNDIGSNIMQVATFTIHVLVGSTVFTITYTSLISNLVSDVIAGLSASASGQGFSIVSSSSNELVISRANQVLLDNNILWDITAQDNSNSSFVYDWASKFVKGLVYWDGKERTNGVLYSASVITADYSESGGVALLPYITASINHRPPSWAKKFSWVRSNNTTKLRNFYYVSPQTYKDSDFAYISLENRNIFIRENNSAADTMAYSFAAGDRIKFIKLINIEAGTSTFPVNKDFELVGEVFTPTINSVVHEGQFLKIKLPATSSTFDFGVQSPNNYNNYFYEIYTPANAIEENLTEYFEFGETYNIGDAGLTTAYHLGKQQSQLPDLSQPATFIFEKGDFYYKPTLVQLGNVAQFQQNGSPSSDGRITLGVDFIDSTFTSPNYIFSNSPYQDLVGFDITTNDDRWLIKVTSGTYTFKIKGTIRVSIYDFGEIYSWFAEDNAGNITYLVKKQLVPEDIDNVFPFEVTVTLDAVTNPRLFVFGYSEGDFNNNKNYSQTDWTITEVSEVQQGIIQRDYSVLFKSAVNSNGRPLVVDEFAAENYFSTKVRFSNEYQLDTNINNTNRFYFENFDDYSRQYGDIMRLLTMDKRMEVLQKRKCGTVPILSAIIRKQTGSGDLIATDELLNPIQYLQEDFGIYNQVLSLTRSSGAYYFSDPVLGINVRRSQDGLIAISEKYKAHYYLNPIISNYLNDYTRAEGTTARILGMFDFFEEEFVSVYQEAVDLTGDTLAFNEERNAYGTFYDLQPEQILCAGNDNFCWKNGVMYKNNNTTNYANFFGVQFSPSIRLVFNKDVNIKKTYQAVSYQANTFWVSDTNGDILTSQPNEQTGLDQISQLKSVDYKIKEALRYAAFLRDANSKADAQLALVNGDELKGVWIQVDFIYKGSSFVWFFLPYVNYDISQRNF